MAYRKVRQSDLPSLGGRADDELLTIEECAAYLGMSPTTLNRWRTGERGVRGGPPWVSMHDGPRSPICYRVGDIRAWLTTRVVYPSERFDTPARTA